MHCPSCAIVASDAAVPDIDFVVSCMARQTLCAVSCISGTLSRQLCCACDSLWQPVAVLLSFPTSPSPHPVGRYRNAYNSLRDGKQPSGIKHRTAAGANPHRRNAKHSTNVAQLALLSSPAKGKPRVGCLKQGPSKQHLLSAEMDLAASGFLQPARPSAISAASHSIEEPPAHAHRHSQHWQKLTTPAAAPPHSSDELHPTKHCRQRQDQQQQPSMSAESLPVTDEHPLVTSLRLNQPPHRQQQQQSALLQQPQHLPRASAHWQTGDDGAESQGYSPGAKHLLQITGLISEDQELMEEADGELILTQPEENVMVSAQDHAMLQHLQRTATGPHETCQRPLHLYSCTGSMHIMVQLSVATCQCQPLVCKGLLHFNDTITDIACDKY